MTEELQPQDAESLEDTQAEDQADAEGEKDWKAEAAKYKAIAERKSKQLEKVSTSIKDEEDKPNKPNTGNQTDGLSRSEAKLYAKGYEDDEIETAKKIAVLNGISIDEAIKDDYVQAKVQARKQAERDKAAQLGSAKSGSFQAKEEPSDRAEHQKWYEEQINKIS